MLLRYTLTSILAVCLISASAQKGCQEHQKMKSIPSNIDNTSAKFARTYWAKRCACESGNITSGTWDYSVEIMNRMYDNYQDPNFLKDYEGDPFPIPDKRMKVSDCKGGNVPSQTVDVSDCMDQNFSSEQDPQQYGNAFLLAKCECEKGVSTKERAKQLEATMKLNYQNCNTYYGNTLGLPAPLSWSDCPQINSSGSSAMTATPSSDRWKMYEDDLINDQARGIIGQLAAESDIPELKQLSEDLNNLSQPNQKLADYHSFFNITPSQADLEFEQFMTNVGQGIAVGKMVVNIIQRKREEKKRRLQWEKKKGTAAIWRIRNNLDDMHHEISKIPTFESYDAETLNKINEIEARYYSYDIATAPERIFLIKYYEGNTWYTVEQLEIAVQRNYERDRSTLLKEIDVWQRNNPDFKNIESETSPPGSLIFANSNYSLANNFSILKIYRMLCYLQLGETEKADKILDQLDPAKLNDQVFALMKEAVYDNDKNAINHLLPLMKAYLEFEVQKNTSESVTKRDDRLMDRLFSEEVVLLYANGIQKKIEMNDLKGAQEEIIFLKRGLQHIYEKDELDYSDEIKFSIIETLEAIVLFEQGKRSEALKKINASTSSERTSGVDFWIKWVKFKMLVDLKEYDNAHRTYNEIIDDYSYAHDSDVFAFDIYELKYAKCELLFEQKEYQRVLKGLMMLEAAKPDLKYNALRYKVYKEMGQTKKAEAELEKIQL